MRFFAALSCLAVAAMSQALLLDNFTVPYSRNVNSGSWVDFQTDETLYTGERDVEVVHLRGPVGEVSLAIGDGQLVVSSAPGVTGGVILEYDGIGDEFGNTGEGRSLIHNPNPNNSFPDGTRLVRFHVESATTAFSSLGVALYQNGQRLFQNGRNPVVGGYQVVDVPFHPDAFRMCDALELNIGGTGSSLIVSRVELVPEPSGAILLAASAVPILRRKRQRRPDNE